ncbi:MAG: formate dehydrogenase subunit alpha [Acidobacteria bacterium]|nr:formate dehydrogenase subunit alpha [Acidobacteriota bacterium]
MSETTNIAYINNEPFEFKPGEMVLSLLRRNMGPEPVPTLCDAPNLAPFGSCRVCSVEVALEKDGPTRTQASCHTPVMSGSYIYTHTEKMKRLRKNIVELVLTDYPAEKFESDNPKHNELKKVATGVGIDMAGVRYSPGKNHFHRNGDSSHPYMRSHLASCINCFRCIRACDEVQGEMVLTMEGRGFDSKIVKGMGQSFMESDCVSCGACSQACPTGAISDVFESKTNDASDVTRTVCTYCGVGCNLDVATKNGEIVSITAPYDAEVNQGHTCLKGRYAFKFYDHPERLRSPMIRKDGELKEVSWDEAYSYMVDKMTSVKNEYGPDAIAGISSARCTNEENYLMQKFIRAVIGTNNIDCCARVCHSPTALGMQRSFGTGAATNSVVDIKYTDCIMIIGANPTDAHPVTGAKMKQAAMKGTTTIVIDPREIKLAKYAQHFLQLRPGTNVALLNMMLYYIISEGLEDKEFIESRTEGYEEFAAGIKALDIDKMEAITGVDREKVRAAAIAYASAPNAMSFHGLGVTEHSQGTFTVQQIADLAMITGNIGRRGVGVNPLRGQNNVQGAADMGAQPHQGAGYLDVTNPEIRNRYMEFYNGADLPLEIGYKIPEMFDAAIAGDLKVMWIIGEDVVQTDPNTNKVIKALKNLDMLVVQELFMTETAAIADVVLPGASFLEKSGTFTNGERRIQRVKAVLDPIPGTKVDGQIIVDVMQRMDYDQPDYAPDTMLEEISQIVPFFNKISWESLGDNGIQWGSFDGKTAEIIHVDEFRRGKGKFEYFDWRESAEILEHGKEFPYIITTNRELEHYNCGAMTRRTGNGEILTEDVLLINPKDAADNGISDGDMTCVISARGKVDIKARITDEVKPGVMSTTFQFPEIMVNVITSDVHDSEAKCPEYKVVACKIRRSKGEKRVLAEARENELVGV